MFSWNLASRWVLASRRISPASFQHLDPTEDTDRYERFLMTIADILEKEIKIYVYYKNKGVNPILIKARGADFQKKEFLPYVHCLSDQVLDESRKKEIAEILIELIVVGLASFKGAVKFSNNSFSFLDGVERFREAEGLALITPEGRYAKSDVFKTFFKNHSDNLHFEEEFLSFLRALKCCYEAEGSLRLPGLPPSSPASSNTLYLRGDSNPSNRTYQNTLINYIYTLNINYDLQRQYSHEKSRAICFFIQISLYMAKMKRAQEPPLRVVDAQEEAHRYENFLTQAAELLEKEIKIYYAQEGLIFKKTGFLGVDRPYQQEFSRLLTEKEKRQAAEVIVSGILQGLAALIKKIPTLASFNGPYSFHFLKQIPNVDEAVAFYRPEPSGKTLENFFNKNKANPYVEILLLALTSAFVHYYHECGYNMGSHTYRSLPFVRTVHHGDYQNTLMSFAYLLGDNPDFEEGGMNFMRSSVFWQQICLSTIIGVRERLSKKYSEDSGINQEMIVALVGKNIHFSSRPAVRLPFGDSAPRNVSSPVPASDCAPSYQTALTWAGEENRGVVHASRVEVNNQGIELTRFSPSSVSSL